MRLLLVGAFPYPLSQGSQVYFQEQAIALREAGATVELLTYARGGTAGDRAGPGAARALDGFRHHMPPTWTAPRRLRSGPGWGKPLADVALTHALHDALMTRSRSSGFDAVLTHNAEACVAGLLASRRRLPVVYCVHTLLGQELSAYLKSPEEKGISRDRSRPGSLARKLDAVGERIDRGLARLVDAWIALTESAARTMRQSGDAPGAVIPPPIPDPRTDPTTLESLRDSDAIARRFGLEPGGFFLYSGNLDAYQELGVLREAARALARELGAAAPPIVIATHDPRREAVASRMPELVFAGVDTADEMIGLLASARAALLPRRALGGFPIKLVNALSVGTATIAFHQAEWGLREGVDSLRAGPGEPGSSFARAMARLVREPGLTARLGEGARALYLDRHLPKRVTDQTLSLLETLF